MTILQGALLGAGIAVICLIIAFLLDKWAKWVEGRSE